MPKAPAGTLYRGREGMWSWVAHRVTGALIFFFLFAHVLDTALVRVSPNDYDAVLETYKNPVVNLMEVGLVGEGQPGARGFAIYWQTRDGDWEAARPVFEQLAAGFRPA